MRLSSLIVSFLILVSCLRVSGQQPGQIENQPALKDVIAYHLRVLKKDPQQFESAVILMESYYQIDDYRKSLLYGNIAEDILTNLNLNQDKVEMWTDSTVLFYIYQTRGKSRHKLGDYRKAKKDYFEALEIDERNSDLLVDIGNLYYNVEEYDTALLFFFRAEHEFPDGFKAKFNIANTYFVLKKYDSAIFYYDESIRIKDDFPYAHYYKGSIYNELEDFERAIEAYNRAVQIWPDNAEIYFRRGIAHQSLEKYKESLIDWNTVLFLDSTNYNALRNRSVTYMKLDNKKAALKDLNYLITYNQDEVEGYYLRGEYFYSKKNYKKALHDLENAFNQGFESKYLYLMLGNIYRKFKDKKASCEFLKRAKEASLKLNKKNINFLHKCDQE